MSEQEASKCEALCSKIAELPPKAQEALSNYAEGMIAMKNLMENKAKESG